MILFTSDIDNFRYFLSASMQCLLMLLTFFVVLPFGLRQTVRYQVFFKTPIYAKKYYSYYAALVLVSILFGGILLFSGSSDVPLFLSIIVFTLFAILVCISIFYVLSVMKRNSFDFLLGNESNLADYQYSPVSTLVRLHRQTLSDSEFGLMEKLTAKIFTSLNKYWLEEEKDDDSFRALSPNLQRDITFFVETAWMHLKNDREFNTFHQYAHPPLENMFGRKENHEKNVEYAGTCNVLLYQKIFQRCRGISRYFNDTSVNYIHKYVSVRFHELIEEQPEFPLLRQILPDQEFIRVTNALPLSVTTAAGFIQRTKRNDIDFKQLLLKQEYKGVLNYILGTNSTTTVIKNKKRWRLRLRNIWRKKIKTIDPIEIYEHHRRHSPYAMMMLTPRDKESLRPVVEERNSNAGVVNKLVKDYLNSEYSVADLGINF